MIFTFASPSPGEQPVTLEVPYNYDNAEVCGRRQGRGLSPTPDVEALRGRFELLQARLNAAKIAHLNRTPLDGQEVGYEALRSIAQETIQANYELQKAKYGTIRLKLSVAKLLRRGVKLPTTDPPVIDRPGRQTIT